MKFPLEPLDAESFKPYGHVIQVPPVQNSGVAANQGTAKRFNHVTELMNLRPDVAKTNVCIFRNTPIGKDAFPFRIKLLERHSYSTQMFVPMTVPISTLDSLPLSTVAPLPKSIVVVCLNDPITNKPDLSTLKAFVATAHQGINYHPGIWHHPMIGYLEQGQSQGPRFIDYFCIVHEAGSNCRQPCDDTEEHFYPQQELLLVFE